MTTIEEIEGRFFYGCLPDRGKDGPYEWTVETSEQSDSDDPHTCRMVRVRVGEDLELAFETEAVR